MRRSHLVLTAIGVSAVAVTGSAYTAANTVPTSVAGYGQGSVTGATVTDVDYSPSTSDPTNLDEVVFNSSTDVTGKTATLTLKQGTTVVGTFGCTLGSYASSTMDITCDTSGSTVTFASFNFTGLTVVD